MSNRKTNDLKNKIKPKFPRHKVPQRAQNEMAKKSFEKEKKQPSFLAYSPGSTDKNKQSVAIVSQNRDCLITIHFSSQDDAVPMTIEQQKLETKTGKVQKAPWLLRKEKKIQRSKARAEKRKRRKNRPKIPLWILQDLGTLECKGNINFDGGDHRGRNAESYSNVLQSFVARSRENANIDSACENKPVLKVPIMKNNQPGRKKITALNQDLKLNRLFSKKMQPVSDTSSTNLNQVVVENLLYAVKEIILSEKRYVSDLQTTIDVFQIPLEKMAKNIRRIRNKWSEDINMIFRFTRHVHKISAILLKELEGIDFDSNLFGIAGDNSEDTPLGSVVTVFNDMLPYMNIYSAYCSNYGFADAAVHRMHKVLRKLEKGNSRLRNRRLSDFLVMPVQRVCRYPILLAEILKCLGPKGNYHQKFQQLQEKLKDLASLCDAKMEEVNECSWMIDIFYRLREQCPNLISRGRYYVDHILADVKCTELGQEHFSLNVVLFSDCVLLVEGAWSDASSQLEVTARLDLHDVNCITRGDGTYLLTSASQKSFTLRPTLKPISPGRMTQLRGEDGQITMLDLPSVVFNDSNDEECKIFFNSLSNLARNLQT